MPQPSQVLGLEAGTTQLRDPSTSASGISLEQQHLGYISSAAPSKKGAGTGHINRQIS